MFFFNGVPNYVTSWVILLNLFIIYVLCNNSITPRPYDHIFQKSVIWLQMCRESWKTKKAPNSSFFFNGVHEYVTSWVILVNLFIIYACNHNGITQKPHDHLFQKSGIWLQSVP